MYPSELEKFIYPESPRQDWFTSSWRPGSPLPFGLNLGIVNVLESPDGNENCTDAIAVFADTVNYQNSGDFSYTYGVPWNFWNCALYPNLTRDIRDFNLSVQGQAIIKDNWIDTSLSSSEEVTTFLSTCLVAYCDDSLCDAPSCTMEQLNLNGSVLSASSVDDCLDHICKSAWGNVGNPDIAGIGVVASYMIQIGMSGVAFLTLAMCVFALRKVLNGTRPQTEANILKKVARIQAVLEVLLITLDDFQRAQCCFAIAIDVASLITLQTKASGMTQQDRSATTMASTAGIGPTTWILTCLMALNSRYSALTFWLTFFTWTFSLTVGFYPETLERIVTSSSYPKACGNIPPVYICGFQTGSWGSSSLLLFAPMFSMPLLLVWHLWPTAVRVVQSIRPQTVCRPTPNIYTSPTTASNSIQDMRLRIGWFAGIAVSFVLSSGVLSFWGFTVTLVSYVRDGNVITEWTFGQIVAVAVWLPSLLLFLNDVVHGPVRGRTQQLPDTLELVRVPMVRNNGVLSTSTDLESI